MAWPSNSRSNTSLTPRQAELRFCRLGKMRWWRPVCKSAFVLWMCSDESYVEDDLLCLLNTGEVCVFTVPALRRQIVANVIARDNVLSVLLYLYHQSIILLPLLLAVFFIAFSHCVLLFLCFSRLAIFLFLHMDVRHSTPCSTAELIVTSLFISNDLKWDQHVIPRLHSVYTFSNNSSELVLEQAICFVFITWLCGLFWSTPAQYGTQA